MTRHTYSIAEEPVEGVYEKLIEVGSQFCTKALLVKRATVDLDAQGRELLDKVKTFSGVERETSEWPGTRLLRGTATVVTFDLNAESLSLLKSARGLYRWQQPDRPEDLCLLRADGSTWLACIAHEEDAFLELDEAEALLVQRSIPEMTITLEAQQQ